MGLLDQNAYLAANPDVAKAIASGTFTSAQDHYNQYGKAEGRATSAPAVPAAGVGVASKTGYGSMSPGQQVAAWRAQGGEYWNNPEYQKALQSANQYSATVGSSSYDQQRNQGNTALGGARADGGVWDGFDWVYPGQVRTFAPGSAVPTYVDAKSLDPMQFSFEQGLNAWDYVTLPNGTRVEASRLLSNPQAYGSDSPVGNDYIKGVSLGTAPGSPQGRVVTMPNGQKTLVSSGRIGSTVPLTEAEKQQLLGGAPTNSLNFTGWAGGPAGSVTGIGTGGTPGGGLLGGGAGGGGLLGGGTGTGSSSGGAFAGGNYSSSNFATPNTAGYNSPMARDQLAFMLNQNTPYMQAANNAGLQTAASRGLLNSSLAAEASQKAMVEAAGPIAQQDADFLQNMEKAAREQGYTLEQYAAKHGYDLERLNSEYGWKSASAQYEADLAYRSNYLQAIANINSQDMNQADKEAAIANLSKIYAESKVVGLVDRVTINPDGTVTAKPGPATPPATGGSDQQAPSTGASTDGWRAYQTRAQMPANDRAIYEARYGTTYEPKDIVWLESAANDIKHKLREYPTGGNYQSKYTGVTYKRADVRNTYDKEMEDRAKAAGIQLNPSALQKVFAWTQAPAPAPESGWGNSGGGN